MNVTIEDLKLQLADLHSRYPSFKPDDLFVCWFLRAYLTEDEASAANAVTGGSGDKGVDGVLVDHSAKAVFLIQGKNRQNLLGKSEKRGDVISFAQISTAFADPASAPFNQLLKKLQSHTAKLLSDARQKVITEHYRLWMYYVTLGSVSPSLCEDAQAIVSHAAHDANLEIFDGRRLIHLLRDYMDGVAPPIPTLELEMEQHAGVKVNGVLQRFDSTNRIETWVFSMRGDAVAELYEAAGIRLFARNIRGFLGDRTSVNEGMSSTLSAEPDHFFYYNNGITIICDRAEKRSRSGSDFLRVSNPQVINGQQTSRMLAHHKEFAPGASVLVKVMQVPREENSSFDALVSRIVANTNWQNAINHADLMSNDRVQIEIERALRKVGYIYLRKRQKKGEARRLAGKNFFLISKEELAQTVAACELDPVTVREGKNALFDAHYSSVFPNADPSFYLPRYWTRRHIALASRGKPQRAYAAWLALHFLWSRLKPRLQKGDLARRFAMLCERKDSALSAALSQACNAVFEDVLSYYRANKGTGATALDPSSFFRSKRDRHTDFERYWKFKATKKKRLGDALTRIETAIEVES